MLPSSKSEHDEEVGPALGLDAIADQVAGLLRGHAQQRDRDVDGRVGQPVDQPVVGPRVLDQLADRVGLLGPVAGAEADQIDAAGLALGPAQGGAELAPRAPRRALGAVEGLGQRAREALVEDRVAVAGLEQLGPGHGPGRVVVEKFVPEVDRVPLLAQLSLEVLGPGALLDHDRAQRGLTDEIDAAALAQEVDPLDDLLELAAVEGLDLAGLPVLDRRRGHAEDRGLGLVGVKAMVLEQADDQIEDLTARAGSRGHGESLVIHPGRPLGTFARAPPQHAGIRAKAPGPSWRPRSPPNRREIAENDVLRWFQMFGVRPRCLPDAGRCWSL